MIPAAEFTDAKAVFLSELLQEGLLTAETLQRCERLASETDTPLADVLTRLGHVSEQALIGALCGTLRLPFITREALVLDSQAPEDLNREFLKARRVLPVRLADSDEVLLAMADPFDEETLTSVSFAYRRAVLPAAVLPSDLDLVWEEAQDRPSETGDTHRERQNDLAHVLTEDLGEEKALLADHASGAPVIRTVQRLVGKALTMRASDIHLEPSDDALHVRMRVDGQLEDTEVLPKRWSEPVVSRIKLMARLDIAECRLPQDGRMRASVHGNRVDLRVATFPTLTGESVVLRVLGRQTVPLDLSEIGLPARGLQSLREALSRPHGLVLITGPTGSGKTTTLYAALNALRQRALKVLTVEDPIEVALPGICQLQVKPEIGLDFPSALRAVLRNDPDVIMVGEIRDAETASMAVRASLTGHLVLATLHTNSAIAALTRMRDLGVPEFLVNSTLILASAQRLVRRLCPGCMQRRPWTAQERAWLQKVLTDWTGREDALQMPEAKGCPSCDGRGFQGRLPLFEALRLDDAPPLRNEVEGHLKTARHAAAHDDGLLRHGLQRVLDGQTTLAEVLSVAGVGS